jgi:hypothetical protein
MFVCMYVYIYMYIYIYTYIHIPEYVYIGDDVHQRHDHSVPHSFRYTQFLALLIQKYKYRPEELRYSVCWLYQYKSTNTDPRCSNTQFTGFTSTKVQILTPEKLCRAPPRSQTQFTCFTSSKFTCFPCTL